MVEDVGRHGKFLDINVGGLHLVMHLARAGWIRWKDEVPTLPPAARRQEPARRARRARRPVRARHHRGRHQEEPGHLPGPRPAGRPGHRQPRPRPARPTTSRWRGSARSSPPRAASSSRACSATRAPSPASATPTPTRSCTPPGCRRSSRPSCLLEGDDDTDAGDPLRRHPGHPRRRRRAVARAGRQRAQEREEVATSRCTPRPGSPARCAATRCARCRSPTRACSTAPPARPAASRSPTGG